jgi:hypothetical protein
VPGASVGSAASVFSGGTATVIVGADPVAFGSITKPLVDELELLGSSSSASVDELDDVGVVLAAELLELVVIDDAFVLVDVLDVCVLVG